MSPLLRNKGTSMAPTTENIPVAHAVAVTAEDHAASTSYHKTPSATNSRYRQQDISASKLDVLKQQGYSLGMAKSLQQVKQVFPKRIFIIDNSWSMQQNDGHRMLETNKRGDIRMVSCTRWEEIQECMSYHIRLVGLIEAPTSFRLLNHPGERIGAQQVDVSSSDDVEHTLSIMNRVKPVGCTPLTKHIHTIYSEVLSMAPDLRAKGQRVSISIFTDGLPSDPSGKGGPQQNNEFVDALRTLEGLPVWLVIRLCTDEESVVDFYNELDGQLELSVEVLDDFCGEGKEVYDHNPWLNYGLPLHRLRELGYSDRLLDLLDERTLTKSELRDFCTILFGEEGIPDPNVDWKGFLKVISDLLKTENCQWNPVTKRMQPWLDLKSLDFIYGDSVGFLPCHPTSVWKFLKILRP